MQVAASVTLGCRALVGYVDTCHSFSATRLFHMVSAIVGGRDASHVRCTFSILVSIRYLLFPHYNLFLDEGVSLERVLIYLLMLTLVIGLLDRGRKEVQMRSKRL